MLTKDSGWSKAKASNPSGNCVEVGVWSKASLSSHNGGCVEIGAWRKPTSSNSQGTCVEVGAWTRASLSFANGNCVEAGVWNKAEASNLNGNCVEATARGVVVSVRDTKDPTIEPVDFTLGKWVEFIARVNAGEFPLTDDESYRIGHLVYNRKEWECFLDGAGKGEFDLSPELAAMA